MRSVAWLLSTISFLVRRSGDHRVSEGKRPQLFRSGVFPRVPGTPVLRFSAPVARGSQQTKKLLVALGALLVTSELQAQTSNERTMAEALFRQGRELMSQGKYDEACPKFAESQRQDPGGGTLLNLAVCHEKQGKLASAWGEFQEALAQAKAEARVDRVALAEERIQALEPQLARITVTVTGPVNDLIVTVNGTPLGEAGWGTPMPVDAGSVEVRAEAPGSTPFINTLQIADGQNLTLEVPRLIPLGEASPEPDATVPATEQAPDNTVVYITGGLGLAAVGLGTFFGVRALQESKKADEACGTEYCNTHRATIAEENAVFAGWISTASIGAGLAALGLAAYYYEGSPEPPESTRAHSPGWKLGPSLGSTVVGFEASWHY